jgi:exopolyphosphatase/pppGpp-phosphohydrolase
MDPGRADVILGGVLILSEVMATFESGTCLVSEADILDGMVAELR